MGYETSENDDWQPGEIEAVHRQTTAELNSLMGQRIPKPQTFGDIEAAKGRLKRIRELKELQGWLTE